VMSFEGKAVDVTKVYQRESDHLRELRYKEVESGKLRRMQTTDEHRFWSINKDSWLFAGDLKVGDQLLMAGGIKATLTETTRIEGKVTVYNLDVDQTESFYANGVLAYQNCDGQTNDQVTARLRQVLYPELKNGEKLLFNAEIRQKNRQKAQDLLSKITLPAMPEQLMSAKEMQP